MPIIRLPSLMQYYTDKQAEFFVNGNTVLEAVHAAVEKYPALKFQLFDNHDNLRRHINLFINAVNARDCDGLDTPVGEDDVVRILPAITVGGLDDLIF